MSAEPWPEGYGRLVLAEADSTNAEAARRALSAATWILALRQVAGHGRRGRAWADLPGNFAATLALPVEGGPAQAALRSFAAALALYDALAPLARGGALALKWPNDVLLNGGKVAGILLEMLPRAGWLAIGIGVNLAAAPPARAVEEGALSPVSLKGETDLRVAPEGFLNRLAPAFARWEAALRAHGFAPLREAFLARAARLGEPITARTGRDTLTGVFDTLDETGQLVLRTANGFRRLPAADIYF